MRISRKFVFLAAMAISPLASAGPGDELKALLEQGKAAEAYDQGQAGNSHFGDPVFDFYFGVAAIESGHPSEGILALERYLLNFPQNGNARLELARGYFAIGDDQRAREEFNAVLPGAEGAQRAAIERYLDAIRERESRYKKTAGLFVEAGIGLDSNVNGGVGNSSLVLPVLGPVTVLPAGTRTGDTYTALALGAHASAPIAPGMTLFGTLQADGKFHATDQEFDQTGIGVLGGLSFLSGKDMYRAMLSKNTLWVESDRFRTVTALTGDWQRSLDEWQAVNASLQYGRLDYAGDNSVRDSDLWGISLGYTRGFAHGLQPVDDILPVGCHALPLPIRCADTRPRSFPPRCGHSTATCIFVKECIGARTIHMAILPYRDSRSSYLALDGLYNHGVLFAAFFAPDYP